jgi:hypothetical protein
LSACIRLTFPQQRRFTRTPNRATRRKLQYGKSLQTVFLENGAGAEQLQPARD